VAGCNGSCPIDLVVNDVADKGIIVVASAGNRGTAGPIACPANAAGAIAVGGATYKKSGSSVKVEVADVSSWSWREGKPELVAPSDIPVRVRYYFAMPTWVEITVDEAHLGTSYAAPFVTGALALLLQNKKLRRNSIKSVSDVKAALMGSAEPIKGYSKRAQGNGLINLPGAAAILGVG
jgi:subtilisin family serine protease